MKSLRWGIVGGGMLGMTLAHRLAQAGHQVTIFEADNHIGGLADAWQLGDVVWDRHYHVTLLSDSRLRAILTELELDDEMEWVETKTGFFTDGKLYSMSNTAEFLSFPPLRMIDKLRLGMTIFYGSKVTNWRRLENIPVTSWLKRLSGRRTFEKIWLPLLRSKLGDNYKKTSAAFIWATIARMYAARRTGLKKEMFGYVRGGYARVLDRFEAKLLEQQVNIRTSSPVTKVEAIGNGEVDIQVSNEPPETFDRVVMTVPGALISRMLPQLADTEQTKHDAIEYQGIVCPSLLLRKPLSEYYVTNITDDWVPFTGVIEMTTLVDPVHLQGHSLVYLPMYVPANDATFNLTDEQLRERCVAALEKMYDHFDRDDVLAFRVSRVPHVMAISTLGYSRKLPPMQTSVPNAFAVNSAQIVNGTLNVNETVKLAEEALVNILSQPNQTMPGNSAIGANSHVRQTDCQSVAGS